LERSLRVSLAAEPDLRVGDIKGIGSAAFMLVLAAGALALL